MSYSPTGYLAYVIRFIYPDSTAAASQAIQMAAAFSRYIPTTDFYIHDLQEPEVDIRANYPNVADAPLRIKPQHMLRLPSRLYQNGSARYLTFNTLVAWQLRRINSKQRPLLFLRSQLERDYWSAIRAKTPFFKQWRFVYEAHDIAAMPTSVVTEEDPFAVTQGAEGKQRQRLLGALKNFDQIITVTQALADDLQRWTEGLVQPVVVRHASGLPRCTQPPLINLDQPNIMLGYMGTIDEERGVNQLIQAMAYLPASYHLNLVGRVRSGRENQLPTWLTTLLDEPEISQKVTLIPPVPLTEVVTEIDKCDILLQPASKHTISLRYRAPLKLFDYMVRAKPIIAADVPCHREMLTNGRNALFYKNNDVQDLAAKIVAMTETPMLRQKLAEEAWHQSSAYTYIARAEKILEIVNALPEKSVE